MITLLVLFSKDDLEGCLIDGVCYAPFVANPENPTEGCLPSVSTTAFSVVGSKLHLLLVGPVRNVIVMHDKPIPYLFCEVSLLIVLRISFYLFQVNIPL